MTYSKSTVHVQTIPTATILRKRNPQGELEEILEGEAGELRVDVYREAKRLLGRSVEIITDGEVLNSPLRRGEALELVSRDGEVLKRIYVNSSEELKIG